MLALVETLIEAIKQSAIFSSIYGFFASSAHLSRIVLDYMHVFFAWAFNIILVIAAVVSLSYVFFAIIALFQRKRKDELAFEDKKAPKVTIQIPTRNEIIALRCVRKCLEFDYPKDKYEILIGDDSNDIAVSAEIDEFVDKHAVNPVIKVIRREENIGFKPGNLNNMLKHSNGDIIVIFDSDFVPGKDFLRRIVTPFIYDKNIAAVQAKWKVLNFSENLVTVLATSILHIVHYIFLPIMGRMHSAFLCGSAEAVRKSYLVSHGGWKSGSLTEDIEYSLRLHSKGMKIAYLNDLGCYSEVPSTVKDLSRQQMRWAYGVISAYKEHWRGIIHANSTFKRKCMAFLMAYGYLVPVFIVLLTSFGVFSFITHPPGPIDVLKFVLETLKNIGLTLGLIIASAIALIMAKHGRLFFKMIVSSFSVGFVITYYVFVGIYKAVTNGKMEWFLLKKSKDYMNG